VGGPRAGPNRLGPRRRPRPSREELAAALTEAAAQLAQWAGASLPATACPARPPRHAPELAGPGRPEGWTGQARRAARATIRLPPQTPSRCSAKLAGPNRGGPAWKTAEAVTELGTGFDPERPSAPLLDEPGPQGRPHRRDHGRGRVRPGLGTPRSSTGSRVADPRYAAHPRRRPWNEDRQADFRVRRRCKHLSANPGPGGAPRLGAAASARLKDRHPLQARVIRQAGPRLRRGHLPAAPAGGPGARRAVSRIKPCWAGLTAGSVSQVAAGRPGCSTWSSSTRRARSSRPTPPFPPSIMRGPTRSWWPGGRQAATARTQLLPPES